MRMKEITVRYYLDDEEMERLKRITESYKGKWPDLTEEKMFEAIMQAGSRYDIDGKFKVHERALG